MSGLEQAPFTSVITKSKIVAISGTTMITRAPWPNGQYYRLRKVDIASTTVATSGAIFNFWDQDLSSTTTAAQGSGSSPLLIVGTTNIGSLSGFSTTVINKPMDACPRVPFYAGITVAGTAGASITLELEVV